MTTTEKKTPGFDDSAGLAQLAEQLVDRARSSGVELTGPGGLLSGLTKQVLETALQVEMTDHLGYDVTTSRVGVAGTVVTGRRRKRCAPTSVTSKSACRGIGPARSRRPSSRSMRGGCRGSMMR